MEFSFDIKPIFVQPIVKVYANLLPHTFCGDHRMALDTSTKMQEIINVVGEKSAKAQGLSKPITTAQKVRESENQKVYLLADVEDGKKGSLVGMLKIGKKSLYVFDENGTIHMIEAPCILDFYIHETRQRTGLGKDLFKTMLEEEQWEASKLAIDRPSDKFLSFLRKHYGLKKIIPQMNNFVIFDGFFDQTENVLNQDTKIIKHSNRTCSISSEERIINSNEKIILSNSIVTQSNPIGRYAAPRPTCSMAEIIHSATGETK